MTKIVIIGGGSQQWVPGLVNDLALTPELNQAELVLQDIDFEALKRMVPVCRKIVAHHGSDIQVFVTMERSDALAGADFVVLCVSVGGLDAMRNDLEIPLKYGIHQSVGDTTGPGGLSRAMRHIPFAVQVAREMEELCPDAWLLNLTNPMTAVCRAVTKSTKVKTIGLCHEVSGVGEALADLFGEESNKVLFDVVGVNHLPVILKCRIGEVDGLQFLRDWLSDHDPFEFVEDIPLESPFQVFRDFFAVKLWLFLQTGVFYGAGDRHVIEFFQGFLSEVHQFGCRFGVRLTTIEHRQAMAAFWHQNLEVYQPSPTRSAEQLAPLIGALMGGESGQFVVNIPNQGLIDNLPEGAVVECSVYADGSGIWPIGVGTLPPEVHVVIGPHVDRQEMIVESFLSSRYELARIALASDPLVPDPLLVPILFDDLLVANRHYLLVDDSDVSIEQHSRFAEELSLLNEYQVYKTAIVLNQPAAIGMSVADSTIQELLEHPGARAVMEEHFPGIADNQQLKMAYGMTLKQVSPFASQILTPEKLASVDRALRAL
jgi:alpha-galactosidase